MKVFCLFFALVVGVFGNGGGYDLGLKFSGGIAPFTAEGTEHVRILDEKLDVVLMEDYADVTVRYEMVNEKDGNARVKFGFPVEELKGDWGTEYAPEAVKARKAKEGLSYCRDYSVTMNGKGFTHEYVKDPVTSGDLKAFPGSEVFKGIEGWMVSEMSLRKGQKVTVVIRYKADYEFSHSYISSNETKSAKVFRYRLSTGAVWKGAIAKGVVTISAKGVNAKEMRVMKPVNRFKREGGKLVWRFEDLEPTLADDFEVEATPEFSRYALMTTEGRAGTYEVKGNQWSLVHGQYEVKASSELKEEGGFFPALNVKPDLGGRKLRGDTWAESVDGSGVGEWLEFDMKRVGKLSGLYVQNGYGASGRLFGLNNRVKDFEVIVNGGERVKGQLLDVRGDQFVDLGSVKDPVKSLKLVVKSVYRGSKFDDTCLSGVEMVEAMKEAPKRYGAR